MILEINTALLIGSAIVASLVSAGGFQAGEQYRLMKNAVRFFGLSAILSISMLIELLWVSAGWPQMPDVVIFLVTYLSLASFMGGTMGVVIVGSNRFKDLERRKKKRRGPRRGNPRQTPPEDR